VLPLGVAGHEVGSAVVGFDSVSGLAAPVVGVVSVGLVGLQASFDIALASAVLVPVSAAAVGSIPLDAPGSLLFQRRVLFHVFQFRCSCW